MLAVGGTAGFERRTISGAQRSAVFAEANICGRQTSAGIKGNNGLLKSVVSQQKSKIIITVKGGVGRKDAVVKVRMFGFKIQQNGLE